LKIAALGDVHSPKYLPLLIRCLKEIDWETVNVTILAGDIINKGKVEFCGPVVNNIRRFFRGLILGVMGNEEYDSVKDKLRKTCSVVWLDDSSYELNGVVFIGSRGALDRPTTWQLRNVPNIGEIYASRLSRLQKLLSLNSNKKRVLIVHYAPYCETLEGERRSIWPSLSSTKLTEIIREEKPDIVIHAHAHNSIKSFTKIGVSRIYNVSLPATNRITVIEL